MQSQCLLMCSWDTLLLMLKCTVQPIDATPPTDGQKQPGSKHDAPRGQLQVQAANSKKTVKQTNKKKRVCCKTSSFKSPGLSCPCHPGSSARALAPPALPALCTWLLVLRADSSLETGVTRKFSGRSLRL